MTLSQWTWTCLVTQVSLHTNTITWGKRFKAVIFAPPCCPTCLLEPVQQVSSDCLLQVEVVILLIWALYVQRNVLEHQDVFGFGFLNRQMWGISSWLSSKVKIVNLNAKWLQRAANIWMTQQRKASFSLNVFVNQTSIESCQWCHSTVAEEGLLSCSSSHVSWASFSWGQAEASQNNWEFRTRQRTPPTWENRRKDRRRR